MSWNCLTADSSLVVVFQFKKLRNMKASTKGFVKILGGWGERESIHFNITF